MGKHVVNKFTVSMYYGLKWLFYILVGLLVVVLWGLGFSLISLLVCDSEKPLLLVKIFAACLSALVIISHGALYVIMYERKTYESLISIVWSDKIRRLTVLTLGYYNTYLLSLYFVRFRYSQYELLQYRVGVIYSTLSMIPILNILVYWKAIRESHRPLLKKNAVKLYLKGELITTLIKRDYKELSAKIHVT